MSTTPIIPPSLPPRYRPNRAFPPYTYVTGKYPHPHSDPRGHSFGQSPQRVEPPSAENWRDCDAYLWGLDLFNHGYYWEAHELWEAVWMACGRKGASADFFKSLIKLAAAGVKAREGRVAGVRLHARRALALLQQARVAVLASQSAAPPRLFGLALDELIELAEACRDRAVELAAENEQAAVCVVLPALLTAS